MGVQYFDFTKSFEENKKRYHALCKYYHTDKPTGNLEKMQQINGEWNDINTVEKFKVKRKQINNPFSGFILDEDEYEEQKPEKIMWFKGRPYDLNDENIRATIALRHGGLGLMEFLMTKEWQEHINF